jgi:hypothetical protein
VGERRDTRHRRIRALSTPGQVAGAATNNAELKAHRLVPACPTASPNSAPSFPEPEDSRRRRTAVSCPDNAFRYVKNRSLRDLLAARSIRHLTTRPYRPRTNGKIERFHQTMGREWAHGRSYPSSAHRASLLKDWLEHYNHRRPHSAIGNRPPISRVHNL